MEAHGLGLREDPCQRPEPAERARRLRLVEAADGLGDTRVGVVRREPHGGGELPLGGDRPAEPLQHGAVEQLRVRPAVSGARAQGGELLRARQRADPERRLERRQEGRQPRRVLRVEEVAGADRVGRVRLVARGGAPGGEGVVVPAVPVVGEPEVQPDERAAPVRGLEVLEPLDRPRRPRGERAPDLGLERAVAAEDGGGLRVVLAGVEALRAVELAGLAVVAVAERERQRRVAAAGLGGGRNVASRRHHAEHDDTRRGQRREGDERHDAAPRIHRATIAVALSATRAPPLYNWKPCRATASCSRRPRRRSKRSTRAARRSCSTARTRRCSSTSASATSGSRAASPAPSTSRAATSSRGSKASPPTARARSSSTARSGNRSAFAAKTLSELGYERRISLAGGFTDWKQKRLPDSTCRARSAPEQRDALQPPPADPRGRRGGPAAAARLAHPADRRRRPRLAGRALPRRGRRRHARDRRRRRRRRVEPPAPDRPLDRLARRAEGRLGATARSRRSTPTSRSSPSASG